jgi:putative methionine-R-sulfoxide reductase with GAF domain
MNNRINTSNLEQALQSFKKETGYDFIELLDNKDKLNEYYNDNKDKNYDKYIEESKIIYKEMQNIISNTQNVINDLPNNDEADWY